MIKNAVLKEVRAWALDNPQATIEDFMLRFDASSTNITRWMQSAGFAEIKGIDRKLRYTPFQGIEVKEITLELSDDIAQPYKIARLIEEGYNDISICLRLNTLLETVTKMRDQLKEPKLNLESTQLEITQAVVESKPAQVAEIRHPSAVQVAMNQDFLNELNSIPDDIEKLFLGFNMRPMILKKWLNPFLRFYGIHPEQDPTITKEDIMRYLPEIVQWELNTQVAYTVNKDPKYRVRNPADHQFFPPKERKWRPKGSK